MSSEIKKIKLKDILEITSSKRIFMSEYVDIGIPFYRSKEIIEKAKGGNISTELFITEDKFNDIEKKFGVPVNGDILLTSVGTIGIPYLIQQNDKFYFKDGNLTWFKNFSNKLYNKFMLYWLQSKDAQNKFDMITIGSTQKALTISSLKELEIPLPSLLTQKKIAHILSTLDDKIELNRKMNQTLEEMAQTIFKSWFVDFDPVHAKANCTDEAELENIAKKLGISKAILDLFPNEFEESELGMIPKGWEVVKIEEILKRYQAPKRYKKEAVESFGKTVVLEQGVNIILGYHDGEAEFQATEDEPMFIFGDHTCIMKLSTKPFSISENVIPLSGLIRNGYWTYYATYGQQTFQEYRRHWSELIVKEIVMSDKLLCDLFAKQVKPLILKIEQNILENNELAKTRDTLLPKLLSGEIDVSDLSLEME